MQHPSYEHLCGAMRILSAEMVEKAQSGHPGMPLGMAEIMYALFRVMNFDASCPQWHNRDRFVLSAGHASAGLYACLYLLGYGLKIEDLKQFRQLGSRTPGHPEYGITPGVEATTGPLGQGLGMAAGMALAERMMNHQFPDLVDHHTYVLASDGDMMEGISHEVFSLAGHLGLRTLTVLYDKNDVSIDGALSLSDSTDTEARARACGWETYSVDGHNVDSIKDVLMTTRQTDRPSLIVCATSLAKGVPEMEGNSQAHGAPLGEKYVENLRKSLSFPQEAFAIPDEIIDAWRVMGIKGRSIRQEWDEKLAQHPSQEAFENRIHHRFDEGIGDTWEALRGQFYAEQKPLATRQASCRVLETLFKHSHYLVGGSADLSGSTGTFPKDATFPVSKNVMDGRFIHYGVREHAMGAIMNGLALHGGCVPYGGTFLVFSDYMRPAIRLSALMKQKVIYVLTHDSIGLGEDGPTHQPVEHLVSLRAMVGLRVYRPADALETVDCWQDALSGPGPSAMILSRQALSLVGDRRDVTENCCAQGAWVPLEEDLPHVSLLATGSEVSCAMEVASLLKKDDKICRVVSIPCWERFEECSPREQEDILGSVPRVALEAASPMGWERYTGQNGLILGMRSYGASAPAQDLWIHFHLNPQDICEAIKNFLEGVS